jgi:glycosyltransferase involved in cell wall biosynthesis
MKILNAICFQNIGGVEQVFRDYGESLQHRGHEVRWLISKGYFDNYEGKKIYRLKNITPIFDFIHLLLIVAKFKPDVIFCHSPRAMRLVAFLRFFSKTKTFGINHGVSFKNSKKCNFAISVNEQINQNLINSGFDKSRSFVVQNAVQITEKYQIKEIKTPLVIGIYGRVEEAKGFLDLVKAAWELKKYDIDFRLKIGGFEVSKNFTFEDIKKSAKEFGVLENCDFVGVVRDKKSFFADVDILCVPSYHESFGMVILEGFLFSTLVISSATHGGNFLIKDGENGLLFEVRNYVELAQKVNYILKNPEIYQKLTKQAFLKLETEFSFASLGDRLEEITKLTSQN